MTWAVSSTKFSFLRGRGGTGRRARFRFWWQKCCGSSNLPDRTRNPRIFWGFLFVRSEMRSVDFGQIGCGYQIGTNFRYQS